MKDRCIILATATLLISSGIASAQTPARDLPDAANPSAAVQHPIMLAQRQRTGRHHRQPCPTPPRQSPQNPAGSEKMQPEMDSVGGARPPPARRRNSLASCSTRRFTTSISISAIGATPPHSGTWLAQPSSGRKERLIRVTTASQERFSS